MTTHLTHTRYHQMLRTSLLVFASVLLFDGGFVLPVTEHLADNTYSYLANSVGVVAQIEPNEFNTLASELKEREEMLEAREASLREIEARNFTLSSSPQFSTYILSLILFFLTVLIVTNYVLDWRRDHDRALPV